MTTLLTDDQHAALAARLYEAKRLGRGLVPPPSEEIDFTFEDAYRIRRRFVDLLIADGRLPKGHKIGFTSPAMQQMYGMTGPDFGQLLDDVFVAAGEVVPVSTFSDARVEAELAFELARPLCGPGVTVEAALAATRSVRAAIEVIDSRVGAMRAKAADSIADNAGAGRVVLGDVVLAPGEVDLAAIEITMTVDGATQAGSSSEVMGHPAAPLAWLANRLHELDGLGGWLEAGDIVITGSAIRSVAVAAGSHLHATFGPFGEIEVRFS